ncbi:CPBP family glutamic-type intramembrane protease [Turicibacter sanguinis]|uniref:CPBP family glutamic-type intramembrane protease n=1 Tax=Turicibacter sanguinis TaxID=154288 RepID=UPI00232BB15C|nr:CPBP family glutamic-type intramembrane protease [Turicibacter sanguinis]MDB8543421.1 CPBP family glutamic-type intramembrane protease [Turicibacter sanguinis]
MSGQFKDQCRKIPLISSNWFWYVLVVFGFLFLLKTPVLAGNPYSEFFLMSYHGVFLIFSVTIGFKEIAPLYNKEGGIWRMLLLAGAILFFSALVEGVVGGFLAADDPQQLGQYSFELSRKYVTVSFVRYALVGIGEELFKYMIFLILYYPLCKLFKSYWLPLLISTFVTCFFFGFLHANYNPDEWLTITLIIASGAVVYFYFLIKYQTIIPLMFAHFFQDFLVSLELTEQLEGIYGLTFLLIYMVVLIYIFGKMIKELFKGIKEKFIDK